MLTAAHCVDGVDMGKYPTEVLFDCLSYYCNEGKTINAYQKIIHPGWNVTGDMEDDFAILILESSAEGVPFVKLNPDESYPANGMVSRAMGWGATSYQGDNPDVLLEADLPLLSNAQCFLRESVKDDPEKPAVIGDNKICAYLPGKGTCQGDSGKMTLTFFMENDDFQHLTADLILYSGGPLIIPGTTANEDIQIGVASYGTGCADGWHTSVFAR